MAGMACMIIHCGPVETGNKLWQDIQCEISLWRMMSVDMITECSRWKFTSTEDACCGHHIHQCWVCPKCSKFTADQALLQLQIDCCTLIGSEQACQALLIVLPRHEQVLVQLDSQHAELTQCWAGVCKASGIGLWVAVASIQGLTCREEQWMNALRLLPLQCMYRL